jgi:hypothetical protein
MIRVIEVPGQPGPFGNGFLGSLPQHLPQVPGMEAVSRADGAHVLRGQFFSGLEVLEGKQASPEDPAGFLDREKILLTFQGNIFLKFRLIVYLK